MNRLLRHIVCFKFVDAATASEQQKVEQEFCALAGMIPGIVSLEWGISSSPQNLNKGLTHCFFLTFASEHDRDTYLVHPQHLKFVDLFKRFTDDVFILDYYVRN